MPFYEYECTQCHFHAEYLQKLSDAPLRKCPSCGRNTFRKLVSAPVFRLKGSGWYETDFKSEREAKRNLAGADAEERKAAGATDSPAKGEAKGETRAEGKSEAPAAAGAAAGSTESSTASSVTPPKAAAGAPARSTRARSSATARTGGRRAVSGTPAARSRARRAGLPRGRR